jgi:hypothetical protein
LVSNNAVGAVTAAAAATSGFTIAPQVVGNAFVENVFLVTTTASTGLGGKYFTFSTPSTNYYVWFKVAGVGVDPAPGGTGILVNLATADVAIDVAIKIAAVLNYYTVSYITPIAASGMTAASYWTVSTATTNYYIWYKINNVGTDPALAGKTGIQVTLTGSETAAQVGFATITAINQKYFAVPNLQGWFLRGQDINQALDNGIRYSAIDGAVSTELGSYQLNAFTSHYHNAVHSGFVEGSAVQEVFCQGAPDEGVASITNLNQSPFTADAGGNETRPYNNSVNFVIKY